jgi:DNA invertase Pin-like site-specific DNA recombinase
MSRKLTRPRGPLPEPKRCAIYTRKSTAIGLEQEFNSLDAQREACEKYIEGQGHQGWQVIPEYYDDGGFTGANLERPAFMRLMDDMDDGKVDVIVVYKVDRLSRSLLDFAQVMDRFNRAGVAFVSVTQNFSTADAMGRLTLNMLMSFAEFEREMIAERTRDKIAAARRKGKWTGGAVPLGYDVVDKHLVVNELEAVVVREIFDLYLQHRSALAVMRILNETGRITKRHKAKNGKVRKARAWDKDAVLRVLRNPVYAGFMPYRDEIHDGEHEAIVGRNAFALAQAILDGHVVKKQRRNANPTYILRGLLKCAVCGKSFTPGSTTKKSGKEYRYYRCVTRDKEGIQACVARPLPADAIEEFVIARIREAALAGDLTVGITDELAMKFQERRDELQTERKRLPAAIASLSAEGHKLVETLGTANGTAHRMLEERIEELGAQITHSETRLYQVERALNELRKTEVEASWVADALAHFDDVWDVLTVENQARLVGAVVKRVVVDDVAGTVSAELVDLTEDVEDILDRVPQARDVAPGREEEARP